MSCRMEPQTLMTTSESSQGRDSSKIRSLDVTTFLESVNALVTIDRQRNAPLKHETQNVWGVLLSVQDDSSTDELESASAQRTALPMPHKKGPELYHLTRGPLDLIIFRFQIAGWVRNDLGIPGLIVFVLNKSSPATMNLPRSLAVNSPAAVEQTS